MISLIRDPQRSDSKVRVQRNFMPYFKWVGVDITGAIKKGKLVAYSDQELSQRLFQQGIALMRCASIYTISFLWNINAASRANIFSAIARLLRAGLTVPDVFTIAAQQLDNPFLYDDLFNCARDIRTGIPFAAALKKHTLLCDGLAQIMLIVGHESGNMITAVEYVAAYYEMKHSFKKEIRAALAMPLLTFIFFIGISLFIFIFIMPRFADMFTSMNAQLPAITQYMIVMSEFISSWSMVYIVLGVGLCALLLRRYLRAAGARVWNILVIKIPVVGTVVLNHQLGQFLYGLSLLERSGVPLVHALEVVESLTAHSVVKRFIHIIRMDVHSGILLSHAMAASLVFSSDVIALVNIGEETGTLGSSLLSSAEIYKESTHILLQRLVFFVQPLVIIVLGLLIGMLIFAVYLPIMNLSFSL